MRRHGERRRRRRVSSAVLSWDSFEDTIGDLPESLTNVLVSHRLRPKRRSGLGRKKSDSPRTRRQTLNVCYYFWSWRCGVLALGGAVAAPRAIGGRWREEEGIAFNAVERHQRTRRAARHHTRQNLQHVRRPAGFGTALPLGCSQPARPEAARCCCLRESAAVEEVVRTTSGATAMMASARHKGGRRASVRIGKA